ncbi:MAG TPA: hypothetical protein VMN57_07155 [Anaerolineales bacterium]|nr:hypothetical protein [Anaerolineales bacterium]
MKPERTYRLRSALVGLFFCLPALPLVLRLIDFIYPLGSDYSDLAISHLPNLLYLRTALIESRTLPLWSPTILGGYPFFANPLSGLWYPPGWPAAILPEPWAFNLLAGIHLVFGAYGMGRLLRAVGLRREAQWFGALAFGMLPKLTAHYAAGHISLLYAVVWTPWLLLAELRPLRGRVGPGVMLAAIFLADPRWAAYAGALWLAWSFAKRAGLRTWIRKLALETGVAFLLSGPLVLPLIEYTRLSTRAALTSAETLAFSMPPANLVGLFFSSPIAEWQLYPGAAVLALAAGAALILEIRNRAGFWLAAAGLSLLVAMGEHIPIIGPLVSLPFAGLLRVPPRALFVFGFSLAAGAAIAVDTLIPRPLSDQARYRTNLLLAGLVLLWAAAWVGSRVLQVSPSGPLIGLAATVVLWSWMRTGSSGRRVLPVLFVALFVDLFAAAWTVAAPRPAEEVFSEGAAAAAWLAGQTGDFRIYSPSYSLPQHTAVRYDLEMASGVDPLQLSAYAGFMAEASGVPRNGYSIPLPPVDGEIASANREAIPDPELLALLNVKFVAAEFDLDPDGLALASRFGETRIYENLKPTSALWEIRPDGALVPVEPVKLDRRPNRIELRLDRPGVYFLSEVDYPGWQVHGATELEPYRDVFRTFEVTESGAQVSFVFRPVSLYAGLVLFVMGILGEIVRYRRPYREGKLGIF